MTLVPHVVDLEQIKAHGCDLIDLVLGMAPEEARSSLARQLAEHCHARAGSDRSASGRVRVPVVVPKTPVPPK